MYSSRATEMGRGPKLARLTDAPDWTPGPNAYNTKSDFVKQALVDRENGKPQRPIKQKTTPQIMGGDEDLNATVDLGDEEIIPWNQKGFR